MLLAIEAICLNSMQNKEEGGERRALRTQDLDSRLQLIAFNFSIIDFHVPVLDTRRGGTIISRESEGEEDDLTDLKKEEGRSRGRHNEKKM